MNINIHNDSKGLLINKPLSYLLIFKPFTVVVKIHHFTIDPTTACNHFTAAVKIIPIAAWCHPTGFHNTIFIRIIPVIVRRYPFACDKLTRCVVAFPHTAFKLPAQITAVSRCNCTAGFFISFIIQLYKIIINRITAEAIDSDITRWTAGFRVFLAVSNNILLRLCQFFVVAVISICIKLTVISFLRRFCQGIQRRIAAKTVPAILLCILIS